MGQQNEQKLSYSYSKIETYNKCPANFYWKFVSKEAVDEGHAASHEGTRLHQAIDDRMAKHIPLPEDASPFEEVCQAIEASHGYDDYLYEEELAIREDGTPTDWFDSSAFLRAKIDALLISRESTTWIIDWKTGKRKEKYLKFDQLEINAMLVWACYPDVDHIKVTYVWLKEGHLETPRVYTRGQHYEKFWEKYMKKIDRIEDSLMAGDWPTRPSGLCPWCPSRSICPDARV